MFASLVRYRRHRRGTLSNTPRTALPVTTKVVAMRADRPPLRHTLPELPSGCDELQATTDPGSDTCLPAHLDGLPGLGLDRANLLSNVAIQPTPSVPDDDPTKSEELVLGLDDLLRTNPQGYHALHPRVQQAVSLWALDPLLETIGTRLDKRMDLSAYQYPQYALECRGSAPDKTTLYPPEHHINVIDVLRDLRANDIVTTVCRPDEKVPSQDTIRATFDSMQERGENHYGAFTLLLEDHSSAQPSRLVFHDDVVPDGCPGQTQLFDLAAYRCDQCRVDLRLCTVSDLSSEVRDD